jgi:hypothetical protein
MPWPAIAAVGIVGTLVGVLLSQEIARRNMWRRDAAELLRRILVASAQLTDAAATRFQESVGLLRYMAGLERVKQWTQEAAQGTRPVPNARPFLADSAKSLESHAHASHSYNTIRAELVADKFIARIMFRKDADQLIEAIDGLLMAALFNNEEFLQESGEVDESLGHRENEGAYDDLRGPQAGNPRQRRAAAGRSGSPADLGIDPWRRLVVRHFFNV